MLGEPLVDQYVRIKRDELSLSADRGERTHTVTPMLVDAVGQRDGNEDIEVEGVGAEIVQGTNDS